MRFVPIEQAKFKIDTPVMLQTSSGAQVFGKLVKSEMTKNGSKHTFEVAQFFDEDKPAITPILITDVRYVASLKTANGQPGE